LETVKNNLGKITYITHSNSVGLKALNIDIAKYDAICLVLDTAHIAIESNVFPLSKLILFGVENLSVSGYYSGSEYNGYITLNTDRTAITGIAVSNSSVLLSVYGLRY